MFDTLQQGDMVPADAASRQHRWAELMAEGRTLRDQSRYADAERRLGSAVSLAEQFGALDSRYAKSLDALATVVQIRGRYDEAQILLRRALVIWQQHPGENAWIWPWV